MKIEIDNLRKTIAHHNHQYYVLGYPEIPDSVYDRMFKKLQDMERQYPEFYDPNSPTCRVGSDLLNTFQTVSHLSPMLSVNSVQTDQEIKSFTEGFDTICQLKYDGAGVNLIYKNGKLQKAITHGDGYKGMDVTTNMRTIANLPLTICTMDEIEIRGEVWCPYSEIKRLQSLGENVKSPVAVAINSIKIKYSDKCALRKLKFTAYHITYGVAGSTHAESIAWLNENNFDTPVVFRSNLKTDAIRSLYKRAYPDIPADGIVYKHDSIDICEAEGNNFRTVNWAISWKFDKDICYADVVGTGGKVGANGLVTFFAYIKPLVMNNESITKVQVPAAASFETGETIGIRRKGTRVAVVVSSNGNTRPTAEIPCPQCGTILQCRNSHLYCPAKCQSEKVQSVLNAYQFCFETNPDDYSINPGAYQVIANNEGCRLIPSGVRSNKYSLYYNDPMQLASIGFAVGNYHKSNSCN